jgi:hypothetical protein
MPRRVLVITCSPDVAVWIRLVDWDELLEDDLLDD